LISNVISIHDFFNYVNTECGTEYNKKKAAGNLGNVWKSRSFIYCVVHEVHFKVQICLLNVH